MNTNTNKIKEIGKWMMIIGGSIFTAGTGCYGVANYIERREQKKIHKAELDRIESAHITKEIQLKEEAATARIEKDRIYSEQLKNMDQKAFAKFHADNVARANDDVMNRAEDIRKEADSIVVKAKLECKEKIDKIRKDCLEKIEKAEKEKEEAVKKYEAIDTLFDNKDEIMEAKRSLENAVEKAREVKENKEELLENIKDILSL